MAKNIYDRTSGTGAVSSHKFGFAYMNRIVFLSLFWGLIGLLASLGWTSPAAATVEVREGSVSGNIFSWLLLGPIPNGNAGTRLSTDYLGGEAGTSPGEGTSVAGSNWTAAWAAETFPAGDFINLENYYNGIGASPYYAAFYAFVWINSPVDQEVRLEAGSDDGIQVLINGARALYNDTYRGVNVGNPDQTNVYLKEGWSRVMVKISQGLPGGDHGHCLLRDGPGPGSPTG